jgi:hypothetical protein
MKAFAVHRGANEGDTLGRVLCHDVRGDRNEILFRKGHTLRADDLPLLLATPWTELHMLELGADDLGQHEAGQRLADCLCDASLQRAPSGHRHVLKAKHHGLLEIDAALLERLNSTPGIAVFTLRGDQVVSAEQVVAEAQITPLAIERRSIEETERTIRDAGPVVRVLPFVARDVVLWIREDRNVEPLADKLRRFGCLIRDVVELPPDAASIRRSMEQQALSKATLFLVSGSNALDPLDPTFAALEQLGARMQRVGMPVHPGTLLWIADWNGITVLGLPTCGLGTTFTAFDLVLPRLLAEGGLRDEMLAKLGHGGILTARDTPRGARQPAAEWKAVDEPVR